MGQHLVVCTAPKRFRHAKRYATGFDQPSFVQPAEPAGFKFGDDLRPDTFRLVSDHRIHETQRLIEKRGGMDPPAMTVGIPISRQAGDRTQARPNDEVKAANRSSPKRAGTFFDRHPCFVVIYRIDNSNFISQPTLSICWGEPSETQNLSLFPE